MPLHGPSRLTAPPTVTTAGSPASPARLDSWFEWTFTRPAFVNRPALSACNSPTRSLTACCSRAADSHAVASRSRSAASSDRCRCKSRTCAAAVARHSFFSWSWPNTLPRSPLLAVATSSAWALSSSNASSSSRNALSAASHLDSTDARSRADGLVATSFQMVCNSASAKPPSSKALPRLLSNTHTAAATARSPRSMPLLDSSFPASLATLSLTAPAAPSHYPLYLARPPPASPSPRSAVLTVRRMRSC
jgi:hypothetical protein